MADKYREYFDVDEEYFPQINNSTIKARPDFWTRTYPHQTFIDMLNSVGYIISAAVEPLITDWMTDMPLNADGDGPVDMPYHTAREQGVKVDGKWYYDGDRVDHEKHGKGTWVFILALYEWRIMFDGKNIPAPMFVLRYCKVIGTIHDEKVE